MSESRDESRAAFLSSEELRALDAIAFRTPGGAASPRPGAGARFGDFEIDREIGRGGMGVVYRAIQHPFGRAVALKVIAEPPAAAADPARADRLDREARILGSLRHEGIVTVHAAGAAPGFRYVAMDLVEGTTLREILSGRAGDWPAAGKPGRLRLALELLHRVASALAAAHERGVVHRDVKPENVLVDRSGRPVLADFGLARDFGAEAATSFTRGFVGTPRYASPEQARGEELTAAADVFSFGLVAFEALTGRPAFGGADTSRLLDAIEWRDPVWPRKISVPKDVRAVVERCLEKRARDRYADAREVESDLALLLRFEPVSAVARNPVARLLRRVTRRPRRAAAAGVLVAVVLAALGGGALLSRRGSLEAERAAALWRLEQAQVAIAAGDPSGARAILEELVESGDPPPGARSLLADRLVHAGERERALGLLRAEIDARGAEATLGDRLAAHVVEVRLGRVSPAAPGPQGAPVSARDHAMASWVAELRGDEDAALAALDRAVALEPAAYEWRYLRGSLNSRTRRYVRAVEDFRLAQFRAPFPRDASREFARSLAVLGRLEEAEGVYRAAIASHPGDASLHAGRARVLLDLARPDDAEAAMSEARRIAPDDGFVLAVASAAAAYRNDHARSREIVESALARLPENPDLLLRMALVELGDERFAKAEETARQLMAFRHYSVDALAILTRALEGMGRRDEAEANYPELRRSDPDNPVWLTRYGHMLYRAGRLEEAEAAFREAIAIDPMRGESYLGLGWICRKTNDYQGAFDAYCRASALALGNVQPRYWLADLLVDLHDGAGALFCLEPVLKVHKGWSDAWALKGYALTETGDLEGAVAAFTKALECAPDYASVRVDRGDVLKRLARDREALADYARARERDPSLAAAWCGEGLLRLESDDPAVRDPAEAERLLERAAELRPDLAEYRAYLERARAR